MVDRRELMAGAVGMGAMTIFPGGGDGGDGEIAQLRAEVAILKREVRQLQRQFPRGLKIRPRPDGTLALGDIPATIEDDGLHFKDTAYGDGLFWDADSDSFADIIGYSGTDVSSIRRRVRIDGVQYLQEGFTINDSVSPKYAWAINMFATGPSSLGSIQLDEVNGFRLTLVPLGLQDGITAPSATSGIAKIYVDTADGDLKVIFGDGVTKTLATDTP